MMKILIAICILVQIYGAYELGKNAVKEDLLKRKDHMIINDRIFIEMP